MAHPLTRLAIKKATPAQGARIASGRGIEREDKARRKCEDIENSRAGESRKGTAGVVSFV
ncbi:hypothetical protein [Caballeronia sp. GAFFF1]|uniref:hypothetical protein n=1 Tax=Caballeronia sp. GAFFF1 TaxID=2921779 RepID=UPI00202893CC|nr:hypothetical protein [Caballeronia sp. GAFFF1]